MGVYVHHRDLRVPSVCFINGGKGRFILLLNLYYKCELLNSMYKYFKSCLKHVFIYEMANYVIVKKYITVVYVRSTIFASIAYNTLQTSTVHPRAISELSSKH